ncbi:hypothetical protein N7457_008875 [Penicillium paradoxum]|uniref:uncharacterized protein n=1 Tax=Penicillium paradoxum TaxID=176176 RepID=UPI002546FF5F|nr:uncharacterized protein N7457_008875 [Penicillium paradoxum]KAJ5773979.1 hypothetical protein N7457_008875 [Penicillium paradoxum]
MFATQSPQTPFRQTHYTPARPSPLGQRTNTTPPWTMSPTRSFHKGPESGTLFSNSPVTFPQLNIQTEPIARHTQNHHSPVPMHFNASASTTPTFSPNTFFAGQPPSSPTSPSRAKPKYEARFANTIANPMRNAAGLARSKTRRMFLNRVRDERDSGRFEARGEQMMHMEHLADRRRWEESMARDGEGVVGGMEIGEEDDMLPDDADALDEFITQEEAMEMALRETQTGIPGRVEQLRNAPNVPFSDDDYDDIFMELSEPQGHQSQDMDMS